MDLYTKKMFDEVPNKSIGKTIESLAYSRNRREDILRMFDGKIPTSIMVTTRSYKNADSHAEGTYTKSSQVTPDNCDDRGFLRAFETSGRGVSSGALSRFPQDVGKAVVLLYSLVDDTVVDPFAGHNSRMELCVSLGRKYIGCDISERFMQSNHEVADYLRNTYGDCRVDLYQCDSRKMPIGDAVGDFTLTSPPYYDIEYYGDEPEQLGKAKTYEGFIGRLTDVAKENFRCLKGGAFCVWFVNDFRRRGVFVPYHTHVMQMLQSVGFILHDMMIVDLGYPIRAAFATQVVEQRILPKRHEYGIVVRKPGIALQEDF